MSTLWWTGTWLVITCLAGLGVVLATPRGERLDAFLWYGGALVITLVSLPVMYVTGVWNP